MTTSTIPAAQGLSGRLAPVTEIHIETILRAVLTTVVIGGASLAIGYFLGSPTRLPPLTAAAPEEDSDNSVGEISDGDLSAITPGFAELCKMVGHFFSGWCFAPTKHPRCSL